MDSEIWRFGACEYDARRQELRVDGVLVRVEAKPLELLRQLLLRDGGLVTREALLEAVWPGVTVVDGSIATAISKLRKALGDDGLIVTIPRVGYRLSVPVTRVSVPTPTMAPVETAAESAHTAAGAGIGRDVRWGIAAAVAVIGIGALLVGLLRGSAPTVTPLRTIAVLPFTGVEGGDGTDALGVAIADETATLLSRVHGVGVRPATTIRSDTATTDARAEGRRLGADTIVTGHVGVASGRTAVTIEAVDVGTGALSWRDSFDAPSDNLMALQVQLALRVRGGLAKALGGTAPEAAHDPSNEEGYALFLRSTALPMDVDENRQAIALLRRSLELDPAYPPTWQALSKRAYVDARYGGATTGSLALASEAAERAVALDPDYVVPAAGLVVSLVEAGDLPRAFTQARALLARRPDSVDVQFAMSYVYRYAGLLDDAARHCEEGFLLDPRNSTSGLRSCAVVFIQRGDEARTTNYLHLDEGSAFSRALMLHADVRHGRVAQARAVAQDQLPEWGTWRLLATCAAGARPGDTALADGADAETAYFAASHLAYCGQTDAAAAMLKRAIAGNYCGYPLVESDPLLAPLRATPAFRALRQEASNCRQRFIAAAQKVEAGG